MTNRNPEYDFTEIEKRWQKKWDEEKTFHAETSAPSKNGKYYILDMFPKMENVYLYTITEFTHLFVDIKHMRTVTEMPVVDRTFQF